MFGKRIEKFLELIKKVIICLFEILISLVRIGLMIILVMGAMASLLLLYKLFPETAIIITKPFYLILKILLKIITVLLYSILVFGISYGIFLVSYNLFVLVTKVEERLKIKDEIRREKFLNDLAKKLNKQKGKR